MSDDMTAQAKGGPDSLLARANSSDDATRLRAKLVLAQHRQALAFGGMRRALRQPSNVDAWLVLEHGAAQRRAYLDMVDIRAAMAALGV